MALKDEDVQAVYLAGEYDVLRNIQLALDHMDNMNPARAYNFLTRAAYYLAMMSTLKIMFDAIKEKKGA